ncbi:helix-turn-helix transcriptional regulator [Bdellovibrio bacteriovorus]
MRSLHKNQQLILQFLLQHRSGATLDELSSHLKITNTATKEHVLKLLNQGYLTFEDSKGTVGRPRRRYLLSELGHDAFPKQYSWLSNSLLALLVEDMGSEGTSTLMKSLADKVALSMKDKFASSASTAELLAKITEAMNDLGYQTVLKQSDIRKGAVLEATNCVYHSVAKQHPELCAFDIQLLKNVSNLNVRLEKCIARGNEVCRFCLTKNK